MILDQRRDRGRIDADITQDPIQLARVPELRELRAQFSTLSDLTDLARET